jgi:rubrerythrin
MPRYNPLDILKEAILLERRGRAFYEKVATQSHNEAVRGFFQNMADEEHRHMQILEAHFKAYSETEKFAGFDVQTAGKVPVADLVLSGTLKAQIAAAGFEAAAISAAMVLEEQAVTLYADRAIQATDPNEKALFRWLADWEHGHLTYLADLDQEIKKQIWHDRQFWPF